MKPPCATPTPSATLSHFKKIYSAVKGDFLFPMNYLGHEHQWVSLDAGLSICQACGAEHICFEGTCPTVQMEQSESVCSISGCVISLSELRMEWGALDRVHQVPSPFDSKNKRNHPYYYHRKGYKCKRNDCMKKGHHGCTLSRDTHDNSKEWPHLGTHIIALRSLDIIEIVVRDILDSPKTLRCLAEENLRDQARKTAYLSKIIRDLANERFLIRPSSPFQRPNLLDWEAKLSWQCRKNRIPMPEASPPFCLSIFKA